MIWETRVVKHRRSAGLITGVLLPIVSVSWCTVRDAGLETHFPQVLPGMRKDQVIALLGSPSWDDRCGAKVPRGLPAQCARAWIRHHSRAFDAPVLSGLVRQRWERHRHVANRITKPSDTPALIQCRPCIAHLSCVLPAGGIFGLGAIASFALARQWVSGE